ncbi:MAG TPA: hypothetical protein VFQ15_01000 [Jiangellaceae bacterium]|nr:hypothetical protein [Jiangellaceae bacterium]
MNSAVGPIRGSLTLGGVIVLIVALSWATAPLTAARTRPAGFDDLIALTAAGLAWIIVAWAGAVLAAEALATLPGVLGRLAGAWAGRLAPAAVRQLARAALGVGILVGPVAAAAAAAPPPLATPGIAAPMAPGPGEQLPAVGCPEVVPPNVGPPNVGPPSVVGLTAAEPDPAPSPRHHVVVEPGDSLWSIATDHLGAGADHAAVAAEWPRWFAANRDEIGPNPDLILPGTRLLPPPPTDRSALA